MCLKTSFFLYRFFLSYQHFQSRYRFDTVWKYHFSIVRMFAWHDQLIYFLVFQNLFTRSQWEFEHIVKLWISSLKFWDCDKNLLLNERYEKFYCQHDTCSLLYNPIKYFKYFWSIFISGKRSSLFHYQNIQNGPLLYYTIQEKSFTSENVTCCYLFW